MKTLKAIALLFGGPLLGILIAFLIGILATPDDPNFVANGGHAASGDGFLIIVFVFVSLVISIPVSIFLASRIFFRKFKTPNHISTI